MAPTSSPFRALIMTGACYIDTLLTVPYFPTEDFKLRATSLTKRRGGNVANALEILQQFDLPTQLILLCVLPSSSSTGSKLVRESLSSKVNMEHCIHRENHEEPASSYIIQAEETGTRTIVNYNELPEMSFEEFHQKVSRDIAPNKEERLWFHFEGREVATTISCVRWLRDTYRNVVISVEVEKPGRPMLDELIPEADVVFFSRSWAESKGYSDVSEFLIAQARITSNAKLLCCTKGEAGAAIIKPRDGVVVEVKGLRVGKVVDTVGAGDTFTAGMLYKMVGSEKDDFTEGVRESVEFANKLAGTKVLQEGFEGVVRKAEVGLTA